MKKEKAFTLAEVLITLTIIGVIAAITIPNLMQKHQEQEMVTRLKSAYSIFSQAYKMAVLENGSPDDWDIGTNDSKEGAKKLYGYFKPYLKIRKECGYGKGCFADHYKALFNNSIRWQPETHDHYYRGMLENGMSFMFWSVGSGCVERNNSGVQKTCGNLMVDINGLKGPNRAGFDYFYLTIGNNMFGAVDLTKRANSYGESCQYNNTSDLNGYLCAGYVLKHGNMDYLRRDVSKD